VKDNFLISIKKQIEANAKNGVHYAGFYPRDLCEMATEAMGKGTSVLFGKDMPATVVETFDLFDYACNELRNQGFKTEAHVNPSSIMFTITW
jgi:hypothetical protein